MTSHTVDNILYDASRCDQPVTALFEPEYWLSRGIGTAMMGGRGQVLFIRDEQRKWVLRHYRRGGLIAKFNGDQYFWIGAEATRSFREWRLLSKLVELTLPVPIPIAARYVRSGLSYRADLITQEITGARSLASILINQSLAPAQWQAIGHTLARFHSHGVQHADLNAHNIVFDSADGIYVLDFDRGVIRTRQAFWVDQVLARLLRSLQKLTAQHAFHFGDQDWQQLLRAHRDELERLAT